MIGSALAVSGHIVILTGSNSFSLKIANISSTHTVYPFFLQLNSQLLKLKRIVSFSSTI